MKDKKQFIHTKILNTEDEMFINSQKDYLSANFLEDKKYAKDIFGGTVVRRKQKGFSLLELLIALVLATMVMILGTQLLMASSNSSIFAHKEKQLQDANRLFAAQTNTAIKYAHAVFTVPEDTFNAPDNKKLTPEWNYLGVKKNVTIPAHMTHSKKEITAKTALVDIKYIGTTKPEEKDLADDEVLITVNKSSDESGKADIHYFKEKILAFSEPIKKREFLYKVTFSKPENKTEGIFSGKESKHLNYTLGMTVVDKSSGKEEFTNYGQIDSKVTALNSIQIVDRGTGKNPAAAIAYRTTAPTIGKSVVSHGVISLVVDNSGSMSQTLQGTGPVNALDRYGANSRMAILVEQATRLLDTFSKQQNLHMALIPFAGNIVPESGEGTSAPVGPQFHRVQEEHATLATLIKNMKSAGATNTGAGLKYAFYKMDEENNRILSESSNNRVKNYLILLVDGESTSMDGMVEMQGNYVIEKGENYYKGKQGIWIQEGHLSKYPLNVMKDVDGHYAWRPGVAKFKLLSKTPETPLRNGGQYYPAAFYDKDGVPLLQNAQPVRNSNSFYDTWKDEYLYTAPANYSTSTGMYFPEREIYGNPDEGGINSEARIFVPKMKFDLSKNVKYRQVRGSGDNLTEYNLFSWQSSQVNVLNNPKLTTWTHVEPPRLAPNERIKYDMKNKAQVHVLIKKDGKVEDRCYLSVVTNAFDTNQQVGKVANAAQRYVRDVAKELYKNPNTYTTNPQSAAALREIIAKKQVYIIGISDYGKGQVSPWLKDIATYFDIDTEVTDEKEKRFFPAKTKEDLIKAFDLVSESISASEWLTDGPEL